MNLDVGRDDWNGKKLKTRLERKCECRYDKTCHIVVANTSS